MIDPNEYIGHLLEHAPKMSSVEAHMVLIDHYETHFEIFDHGDPVARKANPWASVAMHDAEENGETSLLFEMIEKYHRVDIAGQFHLNPLQFFGLPRELVTWLFTLADKRQRVEGGRAEEMENNLKDLKNAARSQ